mmetsp:Transcript_37427/g.99475  ORF Transcript_37427/g.99475 Transcript_37427/m.99475 type:complete len:297 (-) Transcript_37427:139-1029(-)
MPCFGPRLGPRVSGLMGITSHGQGNAFSVCRPTQCLGLPCRAASTSSSSPLRLVLDLDETLVRASCKGLHRRTLPTIDHVMTVNVKDAARNVIPIECSVSLRPGLDKFMDWIRQRTREGLIEGTWLFTTGHKLYTKELLRIIDPSDDIFAGVLTKEICTPTSVPGVLMKDLSRVAHFEEDSPLSRILLVDNNPVSCVLNPDNGVLCRDWLGKESADAELQRISNHIDTLMDRAQTSGDYTKLIADLPGHDRLRERLVNLGKMLSVPPERSPAALRKVLKDVFDESCDIKVENIGGQ